MTSRRGGAGGFLWESLGGRVWEISPAPACAGDVPADGEQDYATSANAVTRSLK